MRLSPIEIRQHRFTTRFRGFDPDEVLTFLEAVVGDFEEVVRENAQLRREAEQLGRDLDALRRREQTVQDTLAAAQTVVEQLKRTALKESEVIVGEAELRSEKLLRETEERRASMAHEITELRHVRERVEVELRKTLEGYLALIDAFRDAREQAPASAARSLATDASRR